jgi:23S rRNA pseudouridine1911/1915/1917 synthase
LLEVLFEDNHLLALNKPNGMLAQGDATGDLPLTHWAERYLAAKGGKPGQAYVGLPHRLDRPCSGVLLLAKTSKAAARLSKQFADRSVQKHYIAVVQGRVYKGRVCRQLLQQTVRPGRQGGGSSVVLRDLPEGEGSDGSERREVREGRTGSEGRDERERWEEEWKEERAGGRVKTHEALLNFEPLCLLPAREGAVGAAGVGPLTALRVRLLTGRKHQIRASLAFLGLPICGDVRYGAAVDAGGQKQGSGQRGGARQKPGQGLGARDIALHAHALVFQHPVGGAPLRITAPLPATWVRRFGAAAVARITAALGGEDGKGDGDGIRDAS